MGPSNQKEKPRERPLSAPSQAAVHVLMSTDPQVKALPPHPYSPRQVQKPQSGSNPTSIAAVKLVSGRPRGRSHSPCYRIDVDIEPEYQGEWRKGMRPAISHESLMVSLDWEATAFNPADPLSQSFPDSALQSALSRHNLTVSNGGNFLQVPDNNHLPVLDKIKRERNAIRGSSSLCDLSVSAPANILKQNLAEVRQMRSHSTHCLLSSSAASQATWMDHFSPTFPPNSPSYSSTSSHSWSDSSTLSPPFSPENLESNMAQKSSTLIHTHLPFPDQSFFPRSISPDSTPHCSPYGSPFGSQTQI